MKLLSVILPTLLATASLVAAVPEGPDVRSTTLITFTKEDLHSLIERTPEGEASKLTKRQCRCASKDSYCCYVYTVSGGLWQCSPDTGNNCN